MQLNSITIMDLIAYGGAALGVILSVTQYRAGQVDLAGCLLIILLSADFFIPMRQLGRPICFTTASRTISALQSWTPQMKKSSPPAKRPLSMTSS